MAKLKTEEIKNKKEWDGFIELHPEANFLQSWEWGEFHENLGKQIQRTGFYQNEKLVGIMLSVLEKAKRGRYLTVPGGPIVDFKDDGLVKLFVEEVRRIGKEAGCSFVRVRPQLESDDFSQKLFKSIGFVSAPMHLHAELTLQLDLNKNEEEILSNMRKNTRYEVKKAISQNIKIEKTTDPKSIKDFYDIQISVSKKKNFVPFPYKFLLEQFKVFAKDGKVLLMNAKFGKDILAQAFVIFYGNEAVYHYGVTTEIGRKYPGAYLIQWEAIKEAKKRGMKRYNFWGVAPENNKNHRFYSLSVFKRGFGGSEFEHLRAQDLVLDRKRYIINYLIEIIRKKLRRV